MEVRRIANGALAGAVGASVWALQQPLDKRVLGTRYDDVELLGKLVTRGDGWPVAGAALHAANGAVFGATYALARPFVPGPPIATAVGAALAEHLAGWSFGGIIDKRHPARGDLESLRGNRRAFAAAAWRHLLFGLVLGAIEQRLNPEDELEPPGVVDVSSNGHGNIERAAVGAA